MFRCHVFGVYCHSLCLLALACCMRQPYDNTPIYRIRETLKYIALQLTSTWMPWQVSATSNHRVYDMIAIAHEFVISAVKCRKFSEKNINSAAAAPPPHPRWDQVGLRELLNGVYEMSKNCCWSKRRLIGVQMKCKYPVYVFKWNEEISLETTEQMKKYKHSMPPRVV